MTIALTGGISVVGGAYFGPEYPPASLKHGLQAPFSFLSISDNLSDFTPGTGAFTIEGFLRTNGPTVGSVTAAPLFWGQINNSIAAEFTTSGSTAAIYFGQFNTSYILSSYFTFDLNVWNWWVIQRDGSNNLSIYWNGNRVYYASNTTNFNVNSSPAFALGCGAVVGGGNYWWNDEFRYTGGTALYSGATIAVPTSEFTADANTKCLLHFSGQNGSTSTTDSTGRHTITMGVNQSLDTSVYKF